MDKKLIAVAAASALALPMAAQLQADEMKVEPHSHSATYGHEHAMEDGSMSPLHAHEHESHPHSELHGHDFSVSGHIARIIQHVDGDGQEGKGPKWKHADAGASPSRFRITGNKDLENGVTVGVNLEYGVGGGSPTLRHSALNFSGAFGKIDFGHTAPATNGTNDDLSTSSLAVDIACSDAVKGADTMTGTGGKPARRSGAVCTDFTAGRRGVVKYTTPAIGALGVSGSVAKDFADAQVTASGELGGGSYALRVSFANAGDNADGIDTATNGNNPGRTLRQGAVHPGDTFSAAAAFKVGGASVNTLWGSVNPDEGEDIDGFGVKLGYDFGNSGVGVVYRQLEIEDDNSEPSTWGLGMMHNMGAVEFWAGYYVTDHDLGTAADDTSTFNVGSRIKF